MKVLALLLLLSSLPARAASLSNSLDAYINAYYLSEDKLHTFDSELETAEVGFLSRSKSYRDLSALHYILDSIARDMKSRIQRKGRFGREVDAFSLKLNELDPAERIAASDLLAELRSSLPGLPTYYSTLSEELAARAAARNLMEARVIQARADRALAAQVSSIAPSFNFRDAPAALPIQPGAGPEGTVNGSIFPLNTWALTYDDGPHDKYTPPILDNLSSFGKKASFLWLVECLEQFPELAARAKSQNLPTNNHSWTHENLDKAKQDTLNKEIVNSTEKDTALYGEKPRFFRLPYGAGLNNKTVRQLIADNGMIHVFWNVDSLDWKDKNPETILARVKKEMNVEKKGIILFHDIHPQSVEGSKLLLKYSSTLDGNPATALRWVSVPEIVDELNHNSSLPQHTTPLN